MKLHLGSLLRFQIKGVSHDPLLGSLHTPLYKFIIDVLLHERTGACTATLALVKEEGKMGLLNGFLHCKHKYEQRSLLNITFIIVYCVKLQTVVYAAVMCIRINRLTVSI